jgi:hypothetical protein
VRATSRTCGMQQVSLIGRVGKWGVQAGAAGRWRSAPQTMRVAARLSRGCWMRHQCIGWMRGLGAGWLLTRMPPLY